MPRFIPAQSWLKISLIALVLLLLPASLSVSARELAGPLFSIPADPSDLAATADSGTQITLNWTDNSSNEDGFHIERSDDGLSGWTEIGDVAAEVTTYQDTTLSCGTQYFYRAFARNVDGDSTPSNVADDTTNACPTPPNAPSGLTATADSGTQITLNWTDNSSDEATFHIERSLDGSTGWTEIDSVAADVTTFQDTTLSCGTTYYYRVFARNIDGDSAPTSSASDTTDACPTPPSAPSGLTANADSHMQITLNWMDNSSDETEFRIERSPEGSSWAEIASVAAGTTAYSNTGLACNTTYQYRVRAYRGGDSQFSTYSNAANTLTSACPPPAVPSGLGATTVSTTQIDLGWTDNSSDETEFRIERSNNEANGWAQIGSTAANATSYSDTSLSCGTLVYYRVRAYRSSPSANSPYTSVVHTSTTLCTPVDLAASAYSRTKIDLSWTDTTSGETEYQIERSDNGSTGWVQVASSPANSTTYRDMGLTEGTTYYYRVRAYDSNTNVYSLYSDTASATTHVPSTDISVNVGPDTAQVEVGSTVIYTLGIYNNGPSVAENVIATNTLPAELNYISSSPNPDTNILNGDGTRTITWNLGMVAYGTGEAITFVVTADTIGDINNTATATSSTDEYQPSSNTHTSTIHVLPPYTPPGDLPPTIIVNSTLDVANNSDGLCTLREAITAANTNTASGGTSGECATGVTGTDVIGFNIPGTGPHKIQPASELPSILTGSGPVTIDGTTEPDFSGTPIIWLDGALASTTDALHIYAANVTVRGLAITGFSNAIWLAGWYDNRVGYGALQGNYIGLNPDGVTANGNGNGVIVETSFNMIGGSDPSERNVISGNVGAGLWIYGGSDNAIQGNYFGTAADGVTARGNGYAGIYYWQVGHHNKIGGINPGEGNVIAYNDIGGILLYHGVRNAILGNRIFNNSGLDIQLGIDQNINDPLDVDDTANSDGANKFQNYPVINSAVDSGGILQVEGVFNSTPNTQFRLEFFYSSTCDENAIGQGDEYLGYTTVITNASGDADFSVTLPGNLPGGYYVSSTATDIYGNTSQFSGCAGNMPAGPLTFIVNSKNDVNDGVCNAAHCSLREALIASNWTHGTDTIRFNIPGAQPYVINPNTPLPALLDPVIIDGTTQPGYTNKPVIELVGTNTSDISDNFAAGIGLRLYGGNTTVKGLAINRFIDTGVLLQSGDNNVIQGNIIGLGINGTNYYVGGTSSEGFGVRLFHSDNNLIGGTTPQARNVISGNNYNVYVEFSDGNTIQGNYLSTNLTGTSTFDTGNFQEGVTLWDSSNNLIGGSASGSRNIVGTDISINSWTSSNNIVQGNYVGTNVSGTASIVVGESAGISIQSVASGNRIGGPNPGEGNLISGNPSSGIYVWGSGTSSTTVTIQGNLIGTDVTGTKALGNGFNGITIGGDQRGVLIGGTNPGEGNTIAFNAGCGVLVYDYSGWGIPDVFETDIQIQGNLIHSNTGQEICLGSDGVTLNDNRDLDEGENQLQNFPVLDSIVGVTSSGGASLLMSALHKQETSESTIVSDVFGARPGYQFATPSAVATETRINGHLNSAPNTQFKLEFFSTDKCETSGYGQAKKFVGMTIVTTDSSGNASFSTNVPLVPSGQFITATAIDPNGNTSEFGLCLATPGTPTAPVLTGPATNYTTNNVTPTLTWLAASHAVSYEVQIDNSSSFTAPIIQTGTVAGLNYTAATLAAGKYFWRVRGINTYGVVGAWSSSRTVVIDILAPGVPTPSSPANNGLVTSATPAISVKAVSGANRYQFEVSTTSDFSGVVVDKTVTTTSTTATPALPFGVYYWRARALDAAGNTGNWSAVRSFTYTLLNLPADASFTTDTTPAFKWKSMSGATGWHLQVDNNSDFSSPEVDHTVGAAILTYSPPSALGFGLYYWKLQVNSASGWSIWMPTRTVTVSPAYPAAPALTGPANGFKTNDNTPTLTWNSVATGDHYQIQIATNSSFTTLVQDVTLGSGVLTFTPPALSDGTKYWRVRALNVYNAPGAWAAYRKVVIDATPPAVPVLNSPADNASTTDKTPALSVKSVSGANLYNFVVATDNAFTNILTDVNVSGTSYTPPTSYPVGPIYWKVRARDAVGNWSAFSAYRTLNIN